MLPINIFGVLVGALKGALGGKASVGAVVDKAISKVAQNPDNALARRDAPAVAEAVIAALPPPRAMESLWPQVLRQLVVFGGGMMAGFGILASTDTQSILALYDAIASGNTEAIGGAAAGVGMIVWRVGSTWLARRAATA